MSDHMLDKARKAAVAIYLEAPKAVADDVAGILRQLCHDIEHLQAENARLREALEWQPISTVPESGPYLVTDGTTRWIVHAELIGTMKEMEQWLGEGGVPTLWTPLPELPAVLTQQEGK